MHGSHCSLKSRFTEVHNSLASCERLTSKELISAEDMEAFIDFAPSDFRSRIFSPDVTLMAFLSQTISNDGSCQQAVARVRADRVAEGLAPCSSNTSSYTRARQRLPLEGIVDLAKAKARQLEEVVPDEWLWKGRHVKVVDGSTILAADTTENQTCFPQHPNQKPGLGFPLVRLAIMTSLASGAALDIELGPFMGKCAGELPLAVKLLKNLKKSDILVADRYYLTYFFIALTISRGADFVTKHFDHRKFNIIKRKRINNNEEIITLKKPRQPHTGWLDNEAYKGIPETINLRRSRVKISRKGYRDEWITIVTTLTDVKSYTNEDLAYIYCLRWNIELDIRIIKQLMNMEFVDAKTPDMIKKNVWIKLLAYNLIRIIMAKSAAKSGQQPRQLSFKWCVDLIKSYQTKWSPEDMEFNCFLFEDLLDALARIKVGNRPGRVAVRLVKRRPTSRSRQMMKPRHAP